MRRPGTGSRLTRRAEGEVDRIVGRPLFQVRQDHGEETMAPAGEIGITIQGLFLDRD